VGAFALGLALLVGLAGTSVWLAGGGGPLGLRELDPPPVAVTAPVADAEIWYPSEAHATGRYRLAGPVLSSGLSGRVTKVRAVAGEKVRAGQFVYYVDHVGVRAYRSAFVFSRPLGLRDKGRDVKELQKLLRRFLKDKTVPADGLVGAATVAAIKRYEFSIGIAKPSGVFDPAWLVRLPASPYRVGAVKLTLGGRAPDLGEPILESELVLRRVKVTTPETDTGPDGAYRFAVEGKAFAVTREAGEWSAADLGGAKAVLGAPEAGLREVYVTGQLRLETPERGQGVPASSIVYSADGSASCVVLPEGGGYRAQAVAIVDSSIDGMALFEPTLQAGAEVLVNPGDMAPELSCR
jgi:hypothetical protein